MSGIARLSFIAKSAFVIANKLEVEAADFAEEVELDESYLGVCARVNEYVAPLEKFLFWNYEALRTGIYPDH